MVNAWWEPLTFQLPTPDAGELLWQRWIDTSQASPYGIIPRTSAPSLEVNSYKVVPQSVVVLIAGLSEVGT
jgi:glycogen operon protein